MYNYVEMMREDIINYIKYEFSYYDFSDKENLFESLYDDMFISDAITGNASGSYFFSTYKSAEALAGNMDLVAEAFDCFGVIDDGMKAEEIECILQPEYQDVTVRCYLLSQVLYDVINELYGFIENEDELTEDIIIGALERI